MEREKLSDTQFGLSLLLDVPNKLELHGKVLRNYTKLEAHPFGLPLPSDVDDILEYYNGAQFIQASSDQTVRYIRYMLYESIGGEVHQLIDKLRIIKVKDIDALEDDQYLLYFEIWVRNYGVIIANSANNYSGAGGEAASNLSAIFKLLSKVYEVEIERVTIAGENGGHIGRMV